MVEGREKWTINTIFQYEIKNRWPYNCKLLYWAFYSVKVIYLATWVDFFLPHLLFTIILLISIISKILCLFVIDSKGRFSLFSLCVFAHSYKGRYNLHSSVWFRFKNTFLRSSSWILVLWHYSEISIRTGVSVDLLIF